MKKVLLSLTFLFLVIGLAQAQTRRPGGGMGQGQRPGGQRNMGASVGLIKYDVDEALKKMKIGEEASITTDIIKSIDSYNHQIDNLRLESKPLFDEMRQQMQGIRQSGDFNQMRIIREESNKKMEPIREQAKQLEAELDAQLKPLLNKKQLKKWKSYKNSKRPAQQGPSGFQRN